MTAPSVSKWIVGEHRSTVLWPNIEAVEAVHGHDGKTRVEFVGRVELRGGAS